METIKIIDELHSRTKKNRAEMERAFAETQKITKETFWYPMLMGATILIVVSGFWITLFYFLKIIS